MMAVCPDTTQFTMCKSIIPVHMISQVRPGPRLNIKTVLFTYGDFHVKDKTAVMGIAIPGKTVFLIETAPRPALMSALNANNNSTSPETRSIVMVADALAPTHLQPQY